MSEYFECCSQIKMYLCDCNLPGSLICQKHIDSHMSMSSKLHKLKIPKMILLEISAENLIPCILNDAVLACQSIKLSARDDILSIVDSYQNCSNILEESFSYLITIRKNLRKDINLAQLLQKTYKANISPNAFYLTVLLKNYLTAIRQSKPENQEIFTAFIENVRNYSLIYSQTYGKTPTSESHNIEFRKEQTFRPAHTSELPNQTLSINNPHHAIPPSLVKFPNNPTTEKIEETWFFSNKNSGLCSLDASLQEQLRSGKLRGDDIIHLYSSSGAPCYLANLSTFKLTKLSSSGQPQGEPSTLTIVRKKIRNK